MKIKIDLSRQGNFILAILLTHFLLFGYICITYGKAATEKLLFFHQLLFDPQAFLAPIILFVIVFFMVFREKFFEYGIRNSIWLTPIIIIQSWIWLTFLNVGVAVSKGGTFNAITLFTLIGEFFTSIEGYITIFSILGLNLLSAILGAITKQKYEKYMAEIKEV